jgi:acyl carrier protein
VNTTEQDVRASIIDYLVRTAHVPPEHLASGAVLLRDLNIDSLTAVEMLWTVESTYGVRLPDSQAGLAAMSIDELVSCFAALLAQRTPAQAVGAPDAA